MRLIVLGNAWPIIPPPAATSTSKNVPSSSEKSRRHSCFGGRSSPSVCLELGNPRRDLSRYAYFTHDLETFLDDDSPVKSSRCKRGVVALVLVCVCDSELGERAVERRRLSPRYDAIAVPVAGAGVGAGEEEAADLPDRARAPWAGSC